MGVRYGGPDWTKINNLVFIDLVLHYGQKDLDFEKDEPTKKRPPFTAVCRANETAGIFEKCWTKKEVSARVISSASSLTCYRHG